MKCRFLKERKGEVCEWEEHRRSAYRMNERVSVSAGFIPGQSEAAPSYVLELNFFKLQLKTIECLLKLVSLGL